MSTFKKYSPFLLSSLLMCVALLLLYPHYQYYIDPDGVSYLTISQRYASGDYSRAVNGYWSPFACWLTAGIMHLGMSAIASSVVINTLTAVGFLYISQSFFIRFNMIRRLQWAFCVSLAVFLCYAVFWQSFDDLWECFFLLSSLRIIIARKFIYKPQLWVAIGILGALAYFSKAYAFPFFIINTICCTFIVAKAWKAPQRRRWMKFCFICVSVMLLCSLPWIGLLHDKYGIWTTSTSGQLNISWYLVGHPYWKENIQLLLPPVYADSHSYWEDPYIANGATPHFWDSLHLFGRQILRIGYNCWKFISSAIQLSFFFPFIAAFALMAARYKKVRALLPGKMPVVILSFLLFPLGYVFINFEARYIWYMVPLAMLMGGLLIQHRLFNKWRNILAMVFPISFLLYPLWGSISLYDAGKSEYIAAKCLKDHHITGAFTAEASGADAQKASRIAYFSGGQYYNMPQKYTATNSLVAEMRRYNIHYCLYYPPHDRKVSFLPDTAGLQWNEFKNDSIKDFRVFVLP